MTAIRAAVLAVALVSGASVLGGCGGGASGPPFTPATVPNDQAIIYIYRPASVMGRSRIYAVCLDGDGTPPNAPRTCVNVIRNGGYVPLKASAGSHHVWAHNGESIDVSVEAGRSYYLRFHVVGATFESVPEAEAKSEIKDCNLSTIK